jgi:drug/metabolite transporter superfamily protein YnfA
VLGVDRIGTPGTRILALGFWAWSTFIAFGAGFLGAALNCEGGEGCKSGSPARFQPWTWDEYSVSPEAGYLGLLGLASASVFVVLVWRRRPALAGAALTASVALLIYPFFAGLTPSGRVAFALGPVLAVVSLASLHARSKRARGLRDHFGLVFPGGRGRR